MSYELLSETTPKARKDYSCIWCGEPIPKGEFHVHEVSKYDGDFQDHRWHPECIKASKEYFSADGEEFFGGEFKRGTSEEK